MSVEETHIETHTLAKGMSDSQHGVQVSEEFGVGEAADLTGTAPTTSFGAVAAAAAGRTSSGSNILKPRSVSSRVSTGGDSVVTVDPKTAIGDTERMTSSQRAYRVHMRDLVRVLQADDRFSEVTVEQVERVKMMHDSFLEGAVFSFNYNTLLLVASVIAALGLASDNSTTIIASMLVSPIMGPVVALAYGTSICDRQLVKLAAFNEVVSLIFCIAVGVVVGAICGSTSLVETWPTQEMKSRCTWTSFFVSLPVAFFSGLGVAVGLLDEQTNSLVGVAISASLLPPAVNAGMIWVSYGLYKSGKLGARDPETDWDDFRHYGSVSLGLTLANILLIWIASMLMFRLKEVLPIKKKVFWSDLGIARKIYQGKALMMATEGEAAAVTHQ